MLREIDDLMSTMFGSRKIVDLDSLELQYARELLAGGSIKGQKNFQTKKQYYMLHKTKVNDVVARDGHRQEYKFYAS